MTSPESAHPCHCGHASTPRFLEHASDYARVNYYRCANCGAVWTVPKDAPQDVPTAVTIQVVRR